MLESSALTAKKIIPASSTKAAADLEFPASLATATSDTVFLRTEEDRGDGVRCGVREDWGAAIVESAATV
ncbi:hypothetical protein QYE76_063502 [Lolium multiflorum]|uniref:Uncharacterized protein n=1 Tax=Lolium multiflorum TaxID=4521 RepID=A0AAD8S543_LOLMU|nr:hypothetical protein QYE76_063502 [Lolium multiflorum]